METYQQLEREFAEFNGLEPENMVACSSGAAALHLACECLNLTGNVVVPEYTMVACARAVSMTGARPVFIDCGDDLNLDPELLWEHIDSLPVIMGVMAVHIYGRPCNMERINRICRHEFSIPSVIEDLAEAHGIKPHINTDAACWSFYKNKIIAGEEGGAVYFKDKWHAERARKMRCLGFMNPTDYGFKHYLHEPRGFNYRMSNAHAELILKSLHYYHLNLQRRREVEHHYNDLIHPGYRQPTRRAPWVYDIKLDGTAQSNVDKVAKALNDQGMPVRTGFKPMSMQSEYRGHYRHLRAYEASQRIVYLPLDPLLTREQVVGYVGALHEVLGV